MTPEELKRQMRFYHPDENVSVRNRQYRWKNPTYEIKNIRTNAENPGGSTVYYEDTGGNKYKTNAQTFVERFGDFYIENSLKHAINILAQVPGYDSPELAVENVNPAGVERSCPNCGHMAMKLEMGAGPEGQDTLKCSRCGFSINNAPDEQFLIAEKKMSKLNDTINKLGQFSPTEQINFFEMGIPRQVVSQLLSQMPLQGTYRITEDSVMFDNPEDASNIKTYLMTAKKAQHKHDLESVLNGTTVVAGEGTIDLTDLDDVTIGMAWDDSGYTPASAIFIMQGYGSEDESLQGAFEILEEHEREAWPDHLKELEEEWGDEANEILTEGWGGTAWTMKPKRAAQIIKKDKRASEFIDIIESTREELGEGLDMFKEDLGINSRKAQRSNKPLNLNVWDKEDIHDDDSEIRMTQEDWDAFDKGHEERISGNPIVNQVRELEEEMGLEPMEFSTLDQFGETWEDYLDYLEEQLVGPSAPPETNFGQFGKKSGIPPGGTDKFLELTDEELKEFNEDDKRKKKKFEDEKKRWWDNDKSKTQRKGQMEQDLDKSQYQERAEDVVRQSKNIPDFGYFGEKDLGNTWAITISQHRDSDIIDESNYAVISSDLEGRFPEDVSDERFNHWAVGWIDHLLVKMLDDQGQVTPVGIAVLEWMDKLDDYPLADEDDYSEREYNEAEENIDNDIKAALDSEGRDELPEDAGELVYTWIREYKEDAIDYVREDPRQHSLEEEVILEAMEELGFLEGQEGPLEGKELWRKNPDQKDLFNKEQHKKEAAYGHSFSPEFYGDVYSPEKKENPTNVADALASMDDEEWNEMAKEVFNVDGDMLDLDTVMTKILEVDTVGSLSSPVDVWIDEEGWYTVNVYDEGEENEDEFYTQEELEQAELEQAELERDNI